MRSKNMKFIVKRSSLHGNTQIPGNKSDNARGIRVSGYSILTAIASLIDGYLVISGDYQICRRPAQPLIEALNDLGAQVFSTRNAGVAPLVIKGPLKGGRTKLPGINSQWLSP